MLVKSGIEKIGEVEGTAVNLDWNRFFVNFKRNIVIYRFVISFSRFISLVGFLVTLVTAYLILTIGYPPVSSEKHFFDPLNVSFVFGLVLLIFGIFSRYILSSWIFRSPKSIGIDIISNMNPHIIELFNEIYTLPSGQVFSEMNERLFSYPAVESLLYKLKIRKNRIDELALQRERENDSTSEEWFKTFLHECYLTSIKLGQSHIDEITILVTLLNSEYGKYLSREEMRNIYEVCFQS